MTIGIDASRANLEHRTGTEWYAFHITQHLIRRHPEVRWRLYVREPLRADLADLVGRSVDVRVLRWRGPLWSQLRLSLELARHPPDVLFVPAHTIPLVHPRATVTTIHDVGFVRRPDLYDPRPIGPRWLQVAVRWLSLGRWRATEVGYHRWSLARALAARAIITVSEFSADEIAACARVPRQRIAVIPHGFDPHEVVSPPSGPTSAARSGLARPFFLYVGRLEIKKGIDRLAAGYAALCAQRAAAPDLVLVGARGYGSGPALTELARLGPRVHRWPWLGANELSALFTAARAFVFPSAYEGFGLPLLNAFAHGTPVVISSQPALVEVAGGAALVAGDTAADLARALDRVDRDETLRRTLMARGEQRFPRFRWATAADATFAVLRRAVGVAW